MSKSQRSLGSSSLDRQITWSDNNPSLRTSPLLIPIYTEFDAYVTLHGPGMQFIAAHGPAVRSLWGEIRGRHDYPPNDFTVMLLGKTSAYTRCRSGSCCNNAA